MYMPTIGKESVLLSTRKLQKSIVMAMAGWWVKWSACTSSTPTIRVKIIMKQIYIFSIMTKTSSWPIYYLKIVPNSTGVLS